MPTFEFHCVNGHARDTYEHHRDDLGCRTIVCEDCGELMAPVFSGFGRGLTYFEEGRGRVLWNLGPEPITVRSHEEHKRLMRERGLEWATEGRGRPGCWV